MGNSENDTADAAGDMQRAVQNEQEQRDTHREKDQKKDKKTVQTGARDYPGPPLPSQQLDKPGMEALMQLKPQFLAPDYRGSGKLAGLAAIIRPSSPAAIPGLAAQLPCCMRAKAPMSRSFTKTNMKTRTKPSTMSKRKGRRAC